VHDRLDVRPRIGSACRRADDRPPHAHPAGAGRRRREPGGQRGDATPHVNFHYEFPLEAIGQGVRELNALLTDEGVPLTVISGAELDAARALELEPEELGGLTLGDSPCLLVESPYQPAGGILEEILYELQLRQFVPVLAHPERCPLFQGDVDHLRRLVDRGILCSVTAGSMSGAFGSTVRRFVLRLFAEGLVHDVSSDAHDPERRPPVLSTGLEAMKGDLRGLAAQWDHYTHDAPAAMLSGAQVPSSPAPPSRPWWRRLLG
jgi:protein-tyrosine phosphatase